jgi:hypothetical protein
MVTRPRNIAAWVAATATIISAATGSVVLANTSIQQPCASETDTSTACQWPASTSSQTDNTPSAPFHSQTPYNLGPR